MKEFIISKAENGFVIRAGNQLYICASLAQVKKVLVQYFEPKVDDPPF